MAIVIVELVVDCEDFVVAVVLLYRVEELVFYVVELEPLVSFDGNSAKTKDRWCSLMKVAKIHGDG